MLFRSAFSLNLQHASCILSFLPPKSYAGIELALLRFLCIRRNPLIANYLLNIIGMTYYLLIITNCICYKYEARLWQTACFWVVLKKVFLGEGAIPARTRVYPVFSTILLGKYEKIHKIPLKTIIYESLRIVLSFILRG